jgi:murein DD-endopeptidase MepM/ murein hydrolase activator NlpD
VVRRFDHAHRIQPTARPLDRRTGRSLTVARRSITPGAATAAGLAIVAILALALRPWDTRPALTATERPAAAVVVISTAPTTSTGAAATLGPHGDVARGDGATDADIARWHDVRRAQATRSQPPPLLGGYRWPMRNARITNGFGLGRPGSFIVDDRTFHDGLDVSSFCGARITAAHDGVVLGVGRHTEALLGWIGDLGPFRAKVDEKDAWGSQAIAVVVDDGNGYRSVYAHLGLAVVDRGDTIRAGDLLGYEGASGNATGCHLHYALFNPTETATLTLDPKVARKTRLPPLEIARIDPLRVLPPPFEAGITWGWGAR